MALSKKLTFALLASASLIGTAAWAQLVTEGGQKFSVILSGANECNATGCGVGDLTASGTADITVNPGQRRICWEITTTNVHAHNTITGAHIHPGVAGVNGPAFIHVTAIKNGTATGCTTTLTPGGTALTRAQIDDIRNFPERYYLNIHWWDTDPTAPALPDYRAGAIRGQLATGRLK